MTMAASATESWPAAGAYHGPARVEKSYSVSVEKKAAPVYGGYGLGHGLGYAGPARERSYSVSVDQKKVAPYGAYGPARVERSYSVSASKKAAPYGGYGGYGAGYGAGYGNRGGYGGYGNGYGAGYGAGYG